MDPLTFVSLVVKAVAWPVTLGTSAYVLREPLTGALGRLGKLRMGAGGFEVDFSEQISKTATAAKTDPDLAGQPDRGAKKAAAPEPIPDHLLSLAAASPKAAVIQVWEEVESAAKRVADRRGIEVDPKIADKPLEVAEKLLDAGVLDETKHEVFRRLRLLRNQAKHWAEMKLSTDDAVSYLDLATRLKSYLDQVKGGTGGAAPTAAKSTKPRKSRTSASK